MVLVVVLVAVVVGTFFFAEEEVREGSYGSLKEFSGSEGVLKGFLKGSKEGS